MQQEISFGEWLRKQRRAVDLSRQAFADQVGCAEVTLRRIEVGTLKPSKELARILLEKLGIPETDWAPWTSFARGLSSFPLASTASSNKSPTNLPAPLTTFIGREKELSEGIKLITKHRLVTLTGTGGVGKTRLSIKVGEQVLGNYADGVWLVELAPILDPLLVPRTTAITIGLRDEPQRPVVDMLADYLREKEILIILDNCEHLLDACAQLADTLLKRCHGLRILVTSREALGILGEAVYYVPSLELPDIQQLVAKFKDYESVQLFEERAQLARIDFSLTIENAFAVAKICTHLDGMPLAIELAAARIGTLSPEQIGARLQENLSLLSTGNRTALPRHQTLQATIKWSHDLLSPAEQSLFRRLSIFVGGWTLEAAESICSDVDFKSHTIFDLLDRLINKSLVIREDLQTGNRYRMLETIRQYSNEKLIESGENDMLHNKHLTYFLNLAETAEPYLIRTEQIDWLPLLDADYENLRLAFEWALSRETAELSLNLCRTLYWFWIIRGTALEGKTWSKRALAKSLHDASDSERISRARVLARLADLEWQLGNFDQILSPAQASLALASEVSDKKDIAIARYFVGVALGLGGRNDDQARTLMEQSLADFQMLSDLFWQAYTFPLLAYILAKQDKLSDHDRYVRALELARKVGERSVLAGTLSNYAYWLFRNKEVQTASKYAEESEGLCKQIGSVQTRINTFLFAEIAWSKGDIQKARSLFIELAERFTVSGDKVYIGECNAGLGLLAMDQGALYEAQSYLEKALMFARDVGFKPYIAYRLMELSNLFYLQGKHKEFKRSFRESLSLIDYIGYTGKSYILLVVLGFLDFQQPAISARLLGVIDHYERNHVSLNPVERRYWYPVETYVRRLLGAAEFESAFAEGRKMTLDEALDVALKTVEEM